MTGTETTTPVERVWKTSELATEWRVHGRKITDTARAHGIGIDMGGAAGYRFTDTDKAQLLQAMAAAANRATKKKTTRKKKRPVGSG